MMTRVNTQSTLDVVFHTLTHEEVLHSQHVHCHTNCKLWLKLWWWFADFQQHWTIKYKYIGDQIEHINASYFFKWGKSISLPSFFLFYIFSLFCFCHIYFVTRWIQTIDNAANFVCVLLWRAFNFDKTAENLRICYDHHDELQSLVEMKLTSRLCRTPGRLPWSRALGQPRFIIMMMIMIVIIIMLTFFLSSIWSAICARNSSSSIPPSPSVSMCCSRSYTSSSVGNIPD